MIRGGHPDPEIRGGGGGGSRSPKNTFRTFGPQFGLKIREGSGQFKSAELQKAENTCSRLLFVISGQNMFDLLKLNDTSEA